MAYRVELTRNAEAELEELYLWVSPKRCRIAPESLDPDRPIRVLNYGRSPHIYRVFFVIDEGAEVVHIVHIRRGARERPAPGDLKRD